MNRLEYRPLSFCPSICSISSFGSKAIACVENIPILRSIIAIIRSVVKSIFECKRTVERPPSAILAASTPSSNSSSVVQVAAINFPTSSSQVTEQNRKYQATTLVTSLNQQANGIEEGQNQALLPPTSKMEARQQLSIFFNVKEDDLLTVEVTLEHWEKLLNSSNVNHLLVVLSKAEIPDTWIKSLVIFFNANKEIQPQLVPFLETLLLPSHLEVILHVFNDVSLFVCLLNLPNGPTALSKVSFKFNFIFTTTLEKTLSLHPELRCHLPTIYSESEVQSFYPGSEVNKRCFLNVLEFYPNLPFPTSNPLLPSLLKDHLGKSFTPIFAWHFKLFSYSALSVLPSQMKHLLIKRLMEDQNPASREILFSWALAGRYLLQSQPDSLSKHIFYRQLATYPFSAESSDVTVFEEIYESLSSDDKKILIKKVFEEENKHKTFYIILYVSNLKIVKAFSSHLLINKHNMYFLLSNVHCFEKEEIIVHSPTLDSLFKSFNREDWREFANARCEKLWLYIFTYLPKLARQNYPELRNDIDEDRLFCSMFKRINESDDDFHTALQVFLSLTAKEKAPVYQAILKLFENPVSALQNCGDKEASIIKKAYQLHIDFEKIVEKLGLQKEWKLLDFLYSVNKWIYIDDELKDQIKKLYLEDKKEENPFPHLKKALSLNQ